VTQAGIYKRAAAAAAASEASDRAGAVLDNLALSLDRFEQAVAREPADWTLHYRAGIATLNLLLAKDYAVGVGPELDYGVLIPEILGLQDWSNLAGLDGALPAPGTVAESLAADETTQEIAAHYRSIPGSQLASLALDFLSAAKERNPLASQVNEAIALVEQIAAITGR
jgi:hypothetical protein